MNKQMLSRMERLRNNPSVLKLELVKYLNANGVVPTGLIINVLEYILFSRKHSTVDHIYKGLSLRDATLSRSGVYSVLDILCSSGVVRAISLDGYSMHYDGDTTPHGHFICESCGEVMDIEIFDEGSFAVMLPEGASLHDAHIICTGECPRCRNAQIN